MAIELEVLDFSSKLAIASYRVCFLTKHGSLVLQIIGYLSMAAGCHLAGDFCLSLKGQSVAISHTDGTRDEASGRLIAANSF